MRKIFEEFQAKKVAEWSAAHFALAGVTNQIAKIVSLRRRAFSNSHVTIFPLFTSGC